MLCALPFAFALGLCPDETISGYSDMATVWHLTDVDGTPYPASATLTFPEEGIAAGSGPCNIFTATQSVPFPWIEIRSIAATKMACPDLEAEAKYFADLQAMTLVEASAEVLLLTTTDGREMVFRAN